MSKNFIEEAELIFERNYKPSLKILLEEEGDEEGKEEGKEDTDEPLKDTDLGDGFEEESATPSDEEDSTDFSEGLANFEPMSNPVITKAPDEKKLQEMPPKNDDDEAVTVEQFESINEHDMAQNNYQQYMNTYVPYYTKTANQANLHGSKDQLMKKLNYMIHLLEKQEDEKTSNVTEELVLYMFLGVFTIFCVDSFARAGKYTR